MRAGLVGVDNGDTLALNRAQGGLQLAHLTCQRGLRNRYGSRGGRQAAGIGHGDEVSKGTQVHVVRGGGYSKTRKR